MKRFYYFHHRRNPEELGEVEITEFLTHLAVNEKVSASTQNQDLNSLLFLYKKILNRSLTERILILLVLREQSSLSGFLWFSAKEKSK
jgi:hypothetical protein